LKSLNGTHQTLTSALPQDCVTRFAGVHPYLYLKELFLCPPEADLRHFVANYFRHQDTKTQRTILANSFALCLCGRFSALSGLGL
jgi:hypothetical protein